MAEKEYIDKEFVINTINELKTKPLPKTIVLEHLQQIIEDISANNIMEVVRCKDCKYRKTEDCAMYCECECGEQHTWENDNDFCSYGERKDG